MRSTLKGLTKPQLNVPGARLKSADKVDNSANIGKITNEIVYIWNQDNPNDMINSATEPGQTPPA